MSPLAEPPRFRQVIGPKNSHWIAQVGSSRGRSLEVSVPSGDQMPVLTKLWICEMMCGLFLACFDRQHQVLNWT